MAHLGVHIADVVDVVHVHHEAPHLLRDFLLGVLHVLHDFGKHLLNRPHIPSDVAKIHNLWVEFFLHYLLLARSPSVLGAIFFFRKMPTFPRALLSAIATACFCGRPEAFSSRILEPTAPGPGLRGIRFESPWLTSGSYRHKSVPQHQTYILLALHRSGPQQY